MKLLYFSSITKIMSFIQMEICVYLVKWYCPIGVNKADYSPVSIYA